jgi:hypothetical protein
LILVRKIVRELGIRRNKDICICLDDIFLWVWDFWIVEMIIYLWMVGIANISDILLFVININVI